MSFNLEKISFRKIFGKYLRTIAGVFRTFTEGYIFYEGLHRLAIICRTFSACPVSMNIPCKILNYFRNHSVLRHFLSVIKF